MKRVPHYLEFYDEYRYPVGFGINFINGVEAYA